MDTYNHVTISCVLTQEIEYEKVPGPRLGVRECIPKPRSKGYVRVNCVKGEGIVRNRQQCEGPEAA